MREILFRGKRTDNGEWVYGKIVEFGYTNEPVQYCIVPTYASALYGIPVDPKTICQYAGLEDQNGKKIFEGDIIKYTFNHPKDPTATENGLIERIGRVFFSNWRSSFSVTAGKNCSSVLNNDLFNYVRNGNRCSVIGNIYDTTEKSRHQRTNSDDGK